MTGFTKWFNTFISEKEIGYKAFELQDSTGMTHFIDSDFVIEAIKTAPKHEQTAIKNMLVKIDYINGDVLDYFKHLAQALVNSY